MTMNKERLLILAHWLLNEFGKPEHKGHKKFDFSKWNSIESSAKCGTSGCAIGECPIVFKDYWKFDGLGSPVLRNTCYDTWYSGIRFFGLTTNQFDFLFVPKDIDHTQGLPEDATKEDVANRIIKFVENGGIYE